MAQRHSFWFPLTVVVAFVALLAAAGFRSAPGVLMDPLHSEFGWSHGTISGAVSLNLLLFGLFSPFATSLMERFGVHRVAAVALAVVGIGSALSVFVSEPWQLWVLWGFLIGAGTGAVSMPFAALVSGRWFTQRRGLVSGVLTAASSTGQLVFLPLLAHLANRHSWQAASLVIAAAAVLAAPVVFLLLKDRPQDVGLVSYGQSPDSPCGVAAPARPALTALGSLRLAGKSREFWLLAGTFAVCGATTVGLVGTHFVPSAHDHGMPATTAASLLALVGIFDIIGTLASGWLTDRIDPRILLVAYYGLRGISLLLLPMMMGPVVEPPLWAFIVFYGLDWVATVPPTMALCREHFGDSGPVFFGWVFASHQVGAGVAAAGAGMIRDTTGSYEGAWFSAAALCGLGAVLCLCIRRVGHRGISGVGKTRGDAAPAPVRSE